MNPNLLIVGIFVCGAGMGWALAHAIGAPWRKCAAALKCSTATLSMCSTVMHEQRKTIEAQDQMIEHLAASRAQMGAAIEAWQDKP